MGAITQSVAWWCFVPGLMTPEQFVRTAADTGFTAIDLVPSAYWALVTVHGLAISSIQGHLPLDVGFNRRDLHDRFEHEVRGNLAHATRLHIPNVLCFSGNRNGLDDATAPTLPLVA